MQNQNEFLNRTEAAKYLGVKYNTLSVWGIKKKFNLPYVKIGGLVKYRKEVLDKFIEERTVHMR